MPQFFPLAIYFWVRIIPIEILRLSVHKWDLLPQQALYRASEFPGTFQDHLFWEALRNTSIIAFGVLLITIPTAMVISALIYHRTRSALAGFYETTVFIPHVASLVPAAMAWKWIFDARLGPLNAFLGMFGIQPQAWLLYPTLSLVSIIVLCSWQALGYAVIIYLVGFKNLPNSLFEAARLDGASGPQSFWFISMPMLKPITLYVSVVTLVSAFNVYAQVFVLASDAQGAPGRQVRVLVLDMIENAFRNYRVGYAASEAVVLLAIVLVLTLIQFTLLREKGARS